MKISLIHPRLVYQPSQQPLGIMYIAAELEKHGFEVQLVEAAFTESDEAVAKRVKEFEADVVGISVMINYFDNALSLATLIKQQNPNCIAVVGGPHASALPEEFLTKRDIDYVMVGECEKEFAKFVSVLSDGKNPKNDSIPGLIWKEGRSKILSAVVDDIDSLAWPARHLLPITSYQHRGYIVSYGMHGGNFNVITSRGCPFRCNFCDHSVFGKNVRYRDTVDVVDEIEYTAKKYKIRNFDIMDDTFTLNKKRIKAFCNEMIRRDLNLYWACRLRVTGVTRELLEIMKKAGCIRFSVGIESVSPKVLKATNKQISMEEVGQVLKWAKQLGFLIIGNFMIGNLGDTWETVMKSAEYAVQSKEIDIPSFVVLTPLPGTEIFELGKQNDWIRTYNWSEYRMNIKELPVMRNEDLSHEDLQELYSNVADMVRPKIQKNLAELHEPRLALYPELNGG